MTGVTLRLDGDEAALVTVGGILARAQHPRGLFENIGMSLVTSTLHRFETGIAPDGSPWPPSLRVLSHGGKTLVESARLMRSVTYVASETGVEIGTNVIYGAIHQLGGQIDQAARSQTLHFKRSKRTGGMLPGFRRKGKGTESREVAVGAYTITMPARPFLGLDDDDTKEIGKLAEDWLAGEDAGDAP